MKDTDTFSKLATVQIRAVNLEYLMIRFETDCWDVFVTHLDSTFYVASVQVRVGL